MILSQKTDCREWQFTEIPEFRGGTMNPVFADCGAGLKEGEASFMHTFAETSEKEILDYTAVLSESGIEKIFENCIDGNLFYQFRTACGLLYISFLKNSGVARFILDRCPQSEISGFGYKAFEPVHDNTVLAQYSLFYDAMIRGTTCDCGMNYVMRLSDNSLIIIDGGEFEQSTDEAVADYMAFLRELTGTQNGEKLRISLWLCTHAHNDHCDFFSKLLRFHSDEITVERAAFNFPNPENTRHSDSVALAKERLLEKFPDVEYIKLHAGCRFNLADAEINVLLSNEDTICFDPEDPFPGTNDTSVIFTVKAGGVKTLFLADCGWDDGDVLIKNYTEETLKSSFLQAAHHGINEIIEVYDRLGTDKVLLPQCRMNMDTRFSETYGNFCRLYGEENILLANDATYIFTLKNGAYEEAQRQQAGGAYDGSEW